MVPYALLVIWMLCAFSKRLFVVLNWILLILQVIVHGVEFDLHICGVDRTAIAVGLAHIGIHGLKDHLTGGIIGDLDLDALGITQKTCPHKAQGVDRALLKAFGINQTLFS